MARKTTTTAPADQSDAPAKTDAPIKASIARTPTRDGVSYPGLLIKGEAPRKGSTLRVNVDGTLYSAKVYGTSEAEGGTLVETEGLTPEAP